MSAIWQAVWERERPPLALRALAQAFGQLVRWRRALYGRGVLLRHRLERPVIVVGNITVGGSGKTPLVIWLCEQLRRAGMVPGVVSRGYGGGAARREPRLVTPASEPAEVGDEAVLLAARTGAPVVVCRDRVRAARHAIAVGAEVIVSDDGLQHLALERDFEIAVLSAARSLGNGYLLPAGPLREPPERLALVDALVLNVDGLSPAQASASMAARNAAGVQFVMHLDGDRMLPLSGQGPALPVASLAGSRAHAIAGIGHPERFFARLRAMGVRVIEHAFPDHHHYRAHELEFGDALPLLMTEKDAVKCRAFAGVNRWFVPVAASFADADAAALMGRIQSSIAARIAPRRSLAVPLDDSVTSA